MVLGSRAASRPTIDEFTAATDPEPIELETLGAVVDVEHTELLGREREDARGKLSVGRLAYSTEYTQSDVLAVGLYQCRPRSSDTACRLDEEVAEPDRDRRVDVGFREFDERQTSPFAEECDDHGEQLSDSRSDFGGKYP